MIGFSGLTQLSGLFFTIQIRFNVVLAFFAIMASASVAHVANNKYII